MHAVGTDVCLQGTETSTCDFVMVAPEGLEPCRPKAMADCSARLSPTFVAPTLSTMLWIPLLTTSYSGSTARVTTGLCRALHMTISYVDCDITEELASDGVPPLATPTSEVFVV